VPTAARPIHALLLRLAAVAFISTLLMLVKLAATAGIALPEIMFWRQAIPALALFGWLAATGGLQRLRSRRIASHAGRAASGMVGMACNFAAAALLPLAEATVLGFTTPLFAVVLSALILREPVGAWRWGAVLLGFLGVLLIARPGGTPIPPLGAAAGLGAGLMVAIISFQIKDLSRTEESISVVFYFALFGALMMAPLLPATMTQHSAGQWLLLLALGLAGAIGQLLLTAALRHGAVASVIVMDYTALIWATGYGLLIWDQLPPATMWVGAPVIVAAGSIVAWRESRFGRRPSPAAAIEAD
jgi:drug/metabolite transporter (DMT)-like permease